MVKIKTELKLLCDFNTSLLMVPKKKHLNTESILVEYPNYFAAVMSGLLRRLVNGKHFILWI